MKYSQKPKLEAICQTFLILVGVTDTNTLVEFINSHDFRLGPGLTRSELMILLKRSPLIRWCKTPQGTVLYYLKGDEELVKGLVKDMLKEKYGDNNFLTDNELDLEVMRYVKV